MDQSQAVSGVTTYHITTEVVFSKFNVCFGGVVVALGDGGLLDDWRQFPLSGHVSFCRQLHVLFFCVVCGDFGVSGWIQDAFVVIVDDLFSIVHAAVTDLDGIAVECFSDWKPPIMWLKV